jgi:hypothetical protein
MIWSSTRAAAVSSSAHPSFTNTWSGCCGRGPPTKRTSGGSSGKPSTASAARVQPSGEPGSQVHAEASNATSPGATRLRRRLSKIFQRLMSGSRLRSRPCRVGTTGSSHDRICQSPRTQRCWRRAWASTLEGKSSTTSTSDTSAQRANRPSNRSCESIAFSATRPSSAAAKGVHVVETLPREAAFAEQVLIGVGHRCGVGINAGVTGVGAREQRAGRTRHRDADPRLEDPVAFDDTPER